MFEFGTLIDINKNQLSLYVHWPYCETKCPYCDFNSHVIEEIDVKMDKPTKINYII